MDQRRQIDDAISDELRRRRCGRAAWAARELASPDFRAIAITVLACAFGGGCSFVSSRPPPSAPDQRTARDAAKCGGVWYPLADTVSVIAGLTWVLRADQLEEDSLSKTYTVTPDGTTLTSTSGGTSYQWMRIAGYAIMGLFGASSVYGYVVEAQCAGLRREISERRSLSAEPLPAARLVPPSNIAGFTFGLSEAQAERVCTGKQQRWEPRGAMALCRTPAPSEVALPLRLEFQSGTLHRVVVLHRSSPELIGKDYDTLYAAHRSMYGGPQRERAALTGTCATAFADCLKNGEKPRGPAWYWPTSSLELQPVWQGEEMLLEERYTREDTIELPVQIDGRVRSRVVLPAAAGKEEIERAALSDPKVSKHLEGRRVARVVVVPRKLINFVV